MIKEINIVSPYINEPVSISTDTIYILGELKDMIIKYDTNILEEADELEITLKVNNIRKIIRDKIDDNKEINNKIIKFIKK